MQLLHLPASCSVYLILAGINCFGECTSLATGHLKQMTWNKSKGDVDTSKLLKRKSIGAAFSPSHYQRRPTVLKNFSQYDCSITLAMKVTASVKKHINIFNHTTRLLPLHKQMLKRLTENGMQIPNQNGLTVLEGISLQTALPAVSFSCDNKVCNICLKCFNKHLCLQSLTAMRASDKNFATVNFQQRKLLQENLIKPKRKETPTAGKPMNDDKGQKVLRELVLNSEVRKHRNDSMSSIENSQNLSELIEELRKDISQEPAWAMISVSFLMVVLVLVGKACGLKIKHRDQEIHIDVEHDFHNVSVMEVLRVKKRYLPKGFYRLRRKLRRKFRRRPGRMKEKDISEPMSDSSGEERLLYDRSYQI